MKNRALLDYDGFLTCNPPLTKEEISLLNNWQKSITEIVKAGEENSDNFSKLDTLIGVDLTKSQRWVLLHYCFSPMISFEENGIKIYGRERKGELRHAITMYFDMFFGKSPFIKNILYKNFHQIKTREFNGYIKSRRLDPANGTASEWVYLVEKNKFYSISCDIDSYIKKPNAKWTKEEKQDTVLPMFDKYFSKEEFYSKIMALLNKNFAEENLKKEIKLKI
jgi:hypothetical protein